MGRNAYQIFPRLLSATPSQMIIKKNINILSLFFIMSILISIYAVNANTMENVTITDTLQIINITGIWCQLIL